MNIVVTFNENFRKPFEILCYSIYRNIKNPESVKLFIIYENYLNIPLLQMISKFYNFKIIFVKIPPEFSNMIDIIESEENLSIYTREASLRIFIPYLLREDRCLYLDTDIVVNRDISKLYNLDIENNYIAAAPDWGLNPKTINSGVLLLDLKKLRENNALITHNELKKIFQKFRKSNFFDQDILDYIYRGHIYKLPPTYNLFLKKDSNNYKENPINLLRVFRGHILHFLGKKPWVIKNADGKYKTLIWKVYCFKYSFFFRKHFYKDFTNEE